MTRPRQPTRAQMRTALRREARALWMRHLEVVSSGAGQFRVEFRLGLNRERALMGDDNPGFTVDGAGGFNRQGANRRLREVVAILLDAQYPEEDVTSVPAETDLKEIKINGPASGETP